MCLSPNQADFGYLVRDGSWGVVALHSGPKNGWVASGDDWASGRDTQSGRWKYARRPQSIRSARSAMTTAWVRSTAPSLAMSAWMPFLTVSSASTMAFAISLFVYPSAR